MGTLDIAMRVVFFVVQVLLGTYIAMLLFDMRQMSIDSVERSKLLIPAYEQRQKQTLDLLDAISNKLDRVKVYIEEKIIEDKIDEKTKAKEEGK